jgi:hypothetical protein
MAKFTNYSMDVKFEGKNVARLGDPMTMNGNLPNTLTAAEIQANLLSAVGPATMAILCIAFCWCNVHGSKGAPMGKKVVRPKGTVQKGSSSPPMFGGEDDGWT